MKVVLTHAILELVAGERDSPALSARSYSQVVAGTGQTPPVDKSANAGNVGVKTPAKGAPERVISELAAVPSDEPNAFPAKKARTAHGGARATKASSEEGRGM